MYGFTVPQYRHGLQRCRYASSHVFEGAVGKSGKTALCLCRGEVLSLGRLTNTSSVS